MGESYLWGWGKDRGVLPSMSYLRGKWQAQHSFLIFQEQGCAMGKCFKNHLPLCPPA